MSFRLFGARITISFALAVLLCAAALLPGKLPPLLLAAILLHEGGHLLYIAAERLRLTEIRLSLTGVRMTLADNVTMTLRRQLLLNCSGPAANLLTAAVTALLDGGVQGERLAAVSLAVATVTLFPLGDSDGAAVMTALLERYGGLSGRAAVWIQIGCSLLAAAVLLALCGAFG